MNLTDEVLEYACKQYKTEPDRPWKTNPEMLPAYHMNHAEWISVLLDGTVEKEKILNLLDLSFELTASGGCKAENARAF